MNVYAIYQTSKRRYLTGGVQLLVPEGQKHRRCSLCTQTLEYPPPESNWNKIELDQGSFVSNILWGRLNLHVTEGFKDAFQNEGFEGIEFEPTEIVEDDRPSKDKKKLPLEQIPQFYRLKLLTNIPYHQDFIELYDLKSCSECGSTLSKYMSGPLIFDGKRHPETDFFGTSYGSHSGGRYCSERGKAFLESYPQTYCRFEQVELRD